MELSSVLDAVNLRSVEPSATLVLDSSISLGASLGSSTTMIVKASL